MFMQRCMITVAKSCGGNAIRLWNRKLVLKLCVFVNELGESLPEFWKRMLISKRFDLLPPEVRIIASEFSRSIPTLCCNSHF